jgi:hypothetical protein
MRWFILAVLAVLLSCLPGSSPAAVNGANAVDPSSVGTHADANADAAAEVQRLAAKQAAEDQARLAAANAATEIEAQADKAREDALEDPLPQSAKVLLKLFVLAVILESALAILFNWRPFIATFDGRATKPLIALVVAFMLVKSLNLDVVGSLVRTYTGYKGAAGDGWLTSLLTAMVIAGGSAGVNRMLRSLGYRSIDVEETKPKPPPTKAWVAAHRGRIALKGPLDDLIDKGDDDWKLAGTILGNSRRPLVGWLLRDQTSFPTVGGFEAAPDETLRVALVKQNAQVPAAENIWGPHKLRAGAIVDIYWPLSRETTA